MNLNLSAEGKWEHFQQQVLPGATESSYNIIFSPCFPSAPFYPQKTGTIFCFRIPLCAILPYWKGLLWQWQNSSNTQVLSLCTSYKGVRLYINTDAPWTIKETTDKLRTGNCLKHLLIFILLACALWAQLQRKLNKSSNILFLSVKDVQFLFPNVYVSSVSLSNTATVQSAYSLFLLPRTALQTDTEAPEKPTQDWEKQEAFKNPY